MLRALAVLLLLAVPALAAPPGHHLPGGRGRTVRERTFHLTAVTAQLRVDMAQEELAGEMRLAFTALRDGLSDVPLDAVGLTVDAVEGAGYAQNERRLVLKLPQPLAFGASGAATIRWHVKPRLGLTFFPAQGDQPALAWTYGEGGMHAGFMPSYGDTNDRCTWDVSTTVAKPYVAIGNGTIASTTENADGTRTFRWVQEQPIPNYLFTLNVAQLERVPLEPARLAAREVPLAAWTPAGTEAAARHTFGESGRMVEFFSRRFGVDYPFPRFDQVVLREYAGAMETAGAVGYSASHLQAEGDPVDAGPEPENALPLWTAEDTIAHELAHHWFGDLVTCRSLSSIWLNESFASFAHLLWTEERHGADVAAVQRWRYLRQYLGYVESTGVVRPLEYARWDAFGDTYQEDTTYVKGALVLQMLRHVTGDAAFFAAVRDYLTRHAYGSVEPADLQAAFERASGRSLAPFFADWIHGGGHPVLEVGHTWSAARKQVDLHLQQTQADLPFENAFALPLTVEIVTASGARRHVVEVAGWDTKIALPSDEEPRAVIVDPDGWLVVDVVQKRTLPEVMAQHASASVAANSSSLESAEGGLTPAGNRAAASRPFVRTMPGWPRS